MGFIKDTFLGGAEQRAAGQQVAAGRRGQDFIRDATTGARGELETGFGGAEDAISQFFQQALGAQGSGLQDVISALSGGAERGISTLQAGEGRGIESLLSALTGAQTQLDPFAQGGQNAFQTQLAQSGALGPEAQAAAFEQFKSSPAQDFLRSQGEQSIARQSAATGGLGGGALKADLQQFGTGLAQQDFQNQFNRLGELAGRGQSASSQLAQASLGTGTNIADLIGRTQGSIAGLETGLGRQLADAFSGSTANISNLLTGQGQSLSGLRTDLGTNLAQLLLGQGTNLSNLEQGIGAAQARGTIGRANALRSTLGDVGGFFSTDTSGLGGGQGGQGGGGSQGGEGGDAAGLFSGIMALFSDRRLKTNITKIGKHGSLNIYEWDWKHQNGGSVGFMSDEVAKICPEAVIQHASGYDMVNYPMAAEQSLKLGAQHGI